MVSGARVRGAERVAHRRGARIVGVGPQELAGALADRVPVLGAVMHVHAEFGERGGTVAGRGMPGAARGRVDRSGVVPELERAPREALQRTEACRTLGVVVATVDRLGSPVVAAFHQDVRPLERDAGALRAGSALGALEAFGRGGELAPLTQHPRRDTLGARQEATGK